MKHIKVTITAMDSLVLTSSSGGGVFTPSANYIAGTIIRGVFSGEYLKHRKEHALGTDVHKDVVFRNLFFDKLRFTNAMPAYESIASFPVPLSLMQNKTKTLLKDLLSDKVKGFKAVRGLAVKKDDKLCTVSVDKSIRFHMSRGGEEDRIKGRHSDKGGQIFNYESIEPGQQFVGEIIGEEDQLNELMNHISGSNFMAHIGRSRFTQYGTVKIQLSEIQDMEKILPPNGNKLFVHVLSPIIPATGIISSVRETLQQIGGNLLPDAKITEVFSAVVPIDNFVNVWGMHRPRVQAIAGGTVYSLEKEQWTDEDMKILNTVLYSGVGQRTQEGFGQLRIWNCDVDKMCSVNCYPKNECCDTIESEMAKNIIRQIVESYINEKIKQFAYKDASSINESKLEGKTHFFARLLKEIDSIRESNNKRQQLSQIIAVNIKERGSSPYAESMESIKIKTCNQYVSLKEYLKNTAREMPYIKMWNTAKDEAGLGELMDRIGMQLTDKDISNGKFFYTYWYWLFRYCRKIAAGKKGDR